MDAATLMAAVRRAVIRFLIGDDERQAPDEVQRPDDGTLRKVYEALDVAGVTGQQATDAVSQMQNQGILFRERG